MGFVFLFTHYFWDFYHSAIKKLFCNITERFDHFMYALAVVDEYTNISA